jgi:cyclophilin family peptidyl-prolyl cis-trans isomerase
MSNKTLGISIAVIILVALAIWGAFRLSKDNEVKNDTAQKQTQNQTSPDNSSQQSTEPTNNQTTVNNSNCIRNFDPAKLNAAINLKNQFVTLDVKDFGQIKVQLYDKDAPKTVENFLKLTNAGYYDCLTFHRVAKEFVVQTGDPSGDGSGGQSAFGGEFADELNANTPSYKTGYVKGVLAMANRGPNTNTSQFFITLADVNANLQKNYTIFGKVVAGMDVVEKIGKVDINPGIFGPTDGSPKVPVVITKATITK